MTIINSEIKDYLRIDNNYDDVLIDTLVSAAIDHCEAYLNRPILDKNMTDANRWKVPESIKIAIFMLVAHWYENRTPVAIGAISSPIALTVNSILAPHRFKNV